MVCFCLVFPVCYLNFCQFRLHSADWELNLWLGELLVQNFVYAVEANFFLVGLMWLSSLSKGLVFCNFLKLTCFCWHHSHLRYPFFVLAACGCTWSFLSDTLHFNLETATWLSCFFNPDIPHDRDFISSHPDQIFHFQQTFSELNPGNFINYFHLEIPVIQVPNKVY